MPGIQSAPNAEGAIETGRPQLAGTLDALAAARADHHYGALLLDLDFCVLGQFRRLHVYRTHDMPRRELGRLPHIHHRGSVVDHANRLCHSHFEGCPGPQPQLERDNRNQHEHSPGHEIGICCGEFEEFVHEVRSGWRRIIPMA